VLTVRGSRPGPTVALLSGVHGDEWEGVVAAGRICRLLRAHDLHGRLLVVSICNEPAFEAMSRVTPEDGRDLARCFPGDPSGSPTERLAALLADRVIRQADLLIDLHSAGLHYTMPTLVGYTGGDGAAGRRSAEAARWFGAPVIWRHPPPVPPGRTISLAFDFGIPSLYAETTGAGGLREADLACYTSGVQNVLRAMSMLAGERSPAPSTLHLTGSGDLDAATVRAHHGGMLVHGVELLQHLEAGDSIGTIVDPAGETVETLRAGRRGVVVMLRHTPRVVAGDRVCHLADLAEAGEEGQGSTG
jgi:predicted deacylase